MLIHPNSFEINFCKIKCIFHGSGAIYLPENFTLIISDMHLEKSFSLNSKKNSGTFLPPYDTKDTLEKLNKVINIFKPKKIISLGDSFHDKISMLSISIKNKRLILQTFANIECIWVTGNHDPILPEWLGGKIVNDYLIENIIFRHISVNQKYEISGHFHPKVKIKTKNKILSSKCFIFNDNRIIMPAFGSFTGGMFLNEIKNLLNNFDDFQIGFCYNDNIYRYPKSVML